MGVDIGKCCKLLNGRAVTCLPMLILAVLLDADAQHYCFTFDNLDHICR